MKSMLACNKIACIGHLELKFTAIIYAKTLKVGRELQCHSDSLAEWGVTHT